MGRYSQALETFQQACVLGSSLDYEISHYIGELLLHSAAARDHKETASQELLEAKQHFLRSVKVGKKLESFQRLAELHRRDKEYLKAIEVLEGYLLYAARVSTLSPSCCRCPSGLI